MTGMPTPPAGRWGLTPLAEAIYRTLILLGPASGPCVGRELGVEPIRIGRGMKELEALGAVNRLSRVGGRTMWQARAAVEVNSLARTCRRPPAGAARPAPAPAGTPEAVLTDRERAILTLLAAGASDEEAAAELGLSRRTVLYAMRSLMDRLGVVSRFQLALALGAAQAITLNRRPQRQAG
ncbi:helix-turn-helix transcriptional regulator [Actinoplanes sp. NPDC023936]|uniref:helix-turn-helix domain-containing protein n=1 Tax=Actinoplanes sp. NPDC023936 TaxID=3154910 RepID=UPI0033FDAA78